MGTVMVDTDVYSYVTSNNPNRGAPYRPHLTGHTVALSFIKVGEQYAGYHKKINKGEWKENRLQTLESLLMLVLVIPYDLEICRTYGFLKYALRNTDGTDRTIAANDLWIAACAVRHKLTLVTHNERHFRGIPGLTIITEPSA